MWLEMGGGECEMLQIWGRALCYWSVWWWYGEEMCPHIWDFALLGCPVLNACIH